MLHVTSSQLVSVAYKTENVLDLKIGLITPDITENIMRLLYEFAPHCQPKLEIYFYNT